MSTDKVIEKFKKGFCTALMGVVMVLSVNIPALAAETDAISKGKDVMTLQQVIAEAEIKAEPDADSETLLKLPAGTGIIVHGEPESSWSHVEYAGVEGYIESSLLAPYNAGWADSGSADSGSTESLEQEMQAVEDEIFRTLDEYEMEQKARRNSIIWGVIIVVLIIAIFAFGVISAVRKGDEDENSVSDESYENDDADSSSGGYTEDVVEDDEYQEENDDIEEIDLSKK